MKMTKIFIITIVMLGLAACATVTPNLTVNQNFWKNRQEIIGVAVVELPAPTAHKGGSQGLLDIAINNAAASDLETHLNSLKIDDVMQLAGQMTGYLTQNGYKAKQLEKTIKIVDLADFEQTRSGADYYASKDFRSFKSKYGIDKLVLITVLRVGTIRDYYGFIPTSEPSGLSHINGKVINLSNNQLEWNQTVQQRVPNMGESWDVPPDFPGLTKAMYAALSQTKQMLFNSFAQ